ncbi:unnamed protein product [Malus baccata var. baccata]
MLCSGGLLAVSFPVNRCSPYKLHSAGCSKFSYPRSPISTSSSRWRSVAMASEPDSSSFAPSVDSDPNPAADTNPAGFCIIEGPETVQDFATMELQEIQDNIRSRRNKIFLHMEESSDNLKQYYAVCYSIIAGFILFGGLISPSLELKLGIGGTSYKDLIVYMHLPLQLRSICDANIVLELDILLVLVAPALVPLFLPNQFQQLVAETSPFHCQKLKDVHIAQEWER